MFNCREEMKYTSEERERKAEKKKNSVCIRGEKLIDCCMNQEMKFFPKGPVPLSTLQKMDKFALKLWIQLSFFLPFYSP